MPKCRDAMKATGKGYDDEVATSYLGGKSWNGLAGEHR
jgi:hypothetical protein